MVISFAQAQWMYTDLTEAKTRVGSTTLGTKVYIAGGDKIDVDFSLVEIYNAPDDSWTYAELSFARTFPVGVSCGGKVLFAGGWVGENGVSDVVDIYDTVTQEWTVAHLSEPRFLISAIAYGTKVLFAGGLNLISMTASNVVDIYDVETGDWEVAHLSEGRFAMGEAVVGDVAVFAGGDKLATEFSDSIDFYNFTTDSWTTKMLFQARGYAAAAAIGDKVMIVGGMTNPSDEYSATDLIETYDLTNESWAFETFPNPRAFIEPACVIANKVYLAGGGNFLASGGHWASNTDLLDIYDYGNGEWALEHLTKPLVNHSVTSLITPELGYLITSGGTSNNVLSSRVEILIDPSVGVEEVVSRQSSVISYPNPFSDFTTIEYGLEHSATVNLSIYNNFGQKMVALVDGEKSIGRHQVRWDASSLPAGIYYYRLTTADCRLTTFGKMVKY